MDSNKDISIIKSMYDESMQRCLTQEYVIKAKQAEIESKDKIIRVLNNTIKGLRNEKNS